jgi:hypothetical protein
LSGSKVPPGENDGTYAVAESYLTSFENGLDSSPKQSVNVDRRFSVLRLNRDSPAKCGDFGAEKVPKSREKDSLAERGGFEPPIELLTL